MPRANELTAGPVYVGVDPGASGGIAVILPDAKTVYPFGNSTDRQTWEQFQFPDPGQAFAAIEQNTGFVGGVGNPGSAMFKFGVSTGKLLGYLVASGIPYELVTPRTWQKGLSIPARKKTESKTQFKNRLKQKAEQLFPGARITLATCDALLIAEWCRRKREGLLT